MSIDKIENKELEIPFIAMGNEELGDDVGDKVICPNCGKLHDVEFGVDTKTGKKSEILGFVSCGDTQYLVAINGKKVP